MFIVAFEALLAGVATELWKGNGEVANELGIIAFVLACFGIALQTIVSVRVKSDTRSVSSLG